MIAVGERGGYQATASLASLRPLVKPKDMLRTLFARYRCDECGDVVAATLGSVVSCSCENVLWHYNAWHCREFTETTPHPYRPMPALLLLPPPWAMQ